MPEKQLDHHFFEMMKQEHEQLARVLGELRHALHSDQRDAEAVTAWIVQLARLVKSHFEHEEEGGYMREAIEQAPRLSEQAENLERQHPVLLEKLSGLSNLAAAGDKSAPWWESARTKFDEFAKSFLDHEAHEDKLVQEAFTQDIGTSD